VKFKRENLKTEYALLADKNPMLYEISSEIESLTQQTFGHDITVTSIYRPKRIWDSGVHSLWRAIDFRSRDINKHELNFLSDLINKFYQYDPDRPHMKVFMVHEVLGMGQHIHVQVHPNTKDLYDGDS